MAFMPKQPIRDLNEVVREGETDQVIIATIARTIEQHRSNYSGMLIGGHWSLSHAHDVLTNRMGIDNLDLMQIAGLAQAMQEFQSTLGVSIY